MKVIDKRQKQSKKKLDLTPGSIIEDESGIWLIHINDDDSKAVSCIKSFIDTWLTSEIAVNHIDDKDLIYFFDGNAHNLKNAKLVIE
jgi:hypothetical protein|nr:MAG TPA: hypothetical protein [Caudoviricetes sp.]